MKIVFEPRERIPFLFPHPLVLVSCMDHKGKDNIITIAAITMLSKVPMLIGFAIHKGRYSGMLIKNSKEFVVNIPTKKFLKEIDICGNTHGKIVDKFELTKLSKSNSITVRPKLINECPVNFECKIMNILEVGQDDFFIGEVKRVHIEKQVIQVDKRVNFYKLNPLIICGENYHEIGDFLESFGFSKE